MIMFTLRTQRSICLALIAMAALWFTATAHAQDPCETGFTQDPALQALSRGIKVPLRFGGCWEPEAADPADREAFAGINGELLGTIAVSIEQGKVTLTNNHGAARSLDIVSGYSPTYTAPAHNAETFAYWEDQTLVLRTNGIEHNTVTVTERISLKGSDTMEYAIHVVPLSQPHSPLTIKIRYHRTASIGGSLPCS